MDAIISDIASLLEAPKEGQHSVTLGLSPSLTLSLNSIARRIGIPFRRPARFLKELLTYTCGVRDLSQDLHRLFRNEGILEVIGEKGFNTVLNQLALPSRALKWTKGK